MTLTLDPRAHDLLDGLLSHGLCRGTGTNAAGTFCVMEAINLAERGLSARKGMRDITDSASCVAESCRRVAIRLNDASGYYWFSYGWSSDAARAKGLTKLAHALLGSHGIDEAA